MIGTILAVLLIWLVVASLVGVVLGRLVKNSAEAEEARREP